MPQVAERRTTMILKGCPKCGGDLSFTSDVYGKYVTCLQCGLLKEVALAPRPVKRQRDVPAERKVA